MTQQRASDVLEHAQRFYRRLSDYFDELAGTTDIERVKLLLTYISESERKRGQELGEYEETAPDDLMDIWFKCGADKATEQCFNSDALPPDMTVDMVVQEAVRLEECLSSLYREMVERAQTEEVKTLFETLLKSNQKHVRNLVRDTEHLTDL